VPPPVARSGGRLRRILVAALLLLTAAGVYAFLNVGRWLAPQDPLTKADAIFVLAGTVAERPLEAADLYQAGYAPKILVTRDQAEQAVAVADSRGATLPERYQLNLDMLVALGVPRTALIVPERVHGNTAAEAETLRDVALKQGWKKVIVVSSTYHLRRVALVCRRQLRGTGVEIVLHATRYDPSVPDRWWTRRSDIRWIVSELPKLLAYSVGLGA
jgi:uncharacterized SAM-binding protein YcdF (DUF218 family)